MDKQNAQRGSFAAELLECGILSVQSVASRGATLSKAANKRSFARFLVELVIHFARFFSRREKALLKGYRLGGE